MCGYDAIMMAFFALACLVWGEHMISFFSPGEGVVRTGVEYFRWVAPSYVGLGVGIVLGSAIQGAGATRVTYLIDQAVIALFQIPACWIAIRVLKTSATGLWLVVALTYWLFAIVYLIFYQRGRFLHTTLH